MEKKKKSQIFCTGVKQPETDIFLPLTPGRNTGMSRVKNLVASKTQWGKDSQSKTRYGNFSTALGCSPYFRVISQKWYHYRHADVEMKPANKDSRIARENQNECSKSVSALFFSSWHVFFFTLSSLNVLFSFYTLFLLPRWQLKKRNSELTFF